MAGTRNQKLQCFMEKKLSKVKDISMLYKIKYLLDGINMISVGIGDKLMKEYLYTIATGNQRNVYEVKTDELNSITSSLQDQVLIVLRNISKNCPDLLFN